MLLESAKNTLYQQEMLLESAKKHSTSRICYHNLLAQRLNGNDQSTVQNFYI